MAPEFEYDPQKSRSNEEKHGINFEQARQLWNDDLGLVIPVRSETEPRYALIATYEEKQWSACFTLREGRVRIISVRRARDNEIELYQRGEL